MRRLGFRNTSRDPELANSDGLTRAAAASESSGRRASAVGSFFSSIVNPVFRKAAQSISPRPIDEPRNKSWETSDGVINGLSHYERCRLNEAEDRVLPSAVRMQIVLRVAQENVSEMRFKMEEDINRLDGLVRTLALYGLLELRAVDKTKSENIPPKRLQELGKMLVAAVQLELMRMNDDICVAGDIENDLFDDLCCDTIQHGVREAFVHLTAELLLSPGSGYKRLLQMRKDQILETTAELAGLRTFAGHDCQRALSSNGSTGYRSPGGKLDAGLVSPGENDSVDDSKPSTASTTQSRNGESSTSDLPPLSPSGTVNGRQSSPDNIAADSSGDFDGRGNAGLGDVRSNDSNISRLSLSERGSNGTAARRAFFPHDADSPVPPLLEPPLPTAEDSSKSSLLNEADWLIATTKAVLDGDASVDDDDMDGDQTPHASSGDSDDAVDVVSEAAAVMAMSRALLADGDGYSEERFKGETRRFEAAEPAGASSAGLDGANNISDVTAVLYGAGDLPTVLDRSLAGENGDVRGAAVRLAGSVSSSANLTDISLGSDEVAESSQVAAELGDTTEAIGSSTVGATSGTHPSASPSMEGTGRRATASEQVAFSEENAQPLVADSLGNNAQRGAEDAGEVHRLDVDDGVVDAPFNVGPSSADHLKSYEETGNERLDGFHAPAAIAKGDDVHADQREGGCAQVIDIEDGPGPSSDISVGHDVISPSSGEFLSDIKLRGDGAVIGSLDQFPDVNDESFPGNGSHAAARQGKDSGATEVTERSWSPDIGTRFPRNSSEHFDGEVSLSAGAGVLQAESVGNVENEATLALVGDVRDAAPVDEDEENDLESRSIESESATVVDNIVEMPSEDGENGDVSRAAQKASSVGKTRKHNTGNDASDEERVQRTDVAVEHQSVRRELERVEAESLHEEADERKTMGDINQSLESLGDNKENLEETVKVQPKSSGEGVSVDSAVVEETAPMENREAIDMADVSLTIAGEASIQRTDRPLPGVPLHVAAMSDALCDISDAESDVPVSKSREFLDDRPQKRIQGEESPLVLSAEACSVFHEPVASHVSLETGMGQQHETETVTRRSSEEDFGDEAMPSPAVGQVGVPSDSGYAAHSTSLVKDAECDMRSLDMDDEGAGSARHTESDDVATVAGRRGTESEGIDDACSNRGTDASKDGIDSAGILESDDRSSESATDNEHAKSNEDVALREMSVVGEDFAE